MRAVSVRATLPVCSEEWWVSRTRCWWHFAMSTTSALHVPFARATRGNCAGADGWKKSKKHVDSVGFRSRHRSCALARPGAGACCDVSFATVMENARAATVVVAPHVTSKIPFLASSRRGSGVVVSLDGKGGELRVLTCAHVACLAGQHNMVDVRASPEFGARTRTGYVVAVHPSVDLALIALDEEEAVSGEGTVSFGNATEKNTETQKEKFPSAYARLAGPGFPLPPGTRVTALGYAMGWSSLVSSLVRSLGGGKGKKEKRFATETRGETLATYEATNAYLSKNENEKITAFILHTAAVASGASGGPLVSENGHVVGVHSFGDAFFGGSKDVAVATPVGVVQALGRLGGDSNQWRKQKCPPEKYATAQINCMILKSSDPALAAMCPELTPTQRKAWIL